MKRFLFGVVVLLTLLSPVIGLCAIGGTDKQLPDARATDWIPAQTQLGGGSATRGMIQVQYIIDLVFDLVASGQVPELEAYITSTLGIEPGAAADMTGTEIKALYEAQTDTNVLTDALLTKLVAVNQNLAALGCSILGEVPYYGSGGWECRDINSVVDWTDTLERLSCGLSQTVAWGGTEWGCVDVAGLITGNESVFNGWDKNAADDFDGAYSSLTGRPTLGTAADNAEEDFEPALGNPIVDDYCFKSSIAGVRSWGECGTGGGSVTGDEAVFDGWDKNAGDDFDGLYSSLTGLPTLGTAADNAETDFESSTSNDFDPDRIAGDVADNDLIDEGIVDPAIARDSEVSTAVSNHEGAGDPHTQYLLNSLVSSFAGNLLDDSTAAEARATLGLGPADDVTFGSVTVAQGATPQAITLFEGSGDGTNQLTITVGAMASDHTFSVVGDELVFDGSPIGNGGSVAIADITDWPSAVSATEVGYLDGVTSSIQNQINALSSGSLPHSETLPGTDACSYQPSTHQVICNESGSYYASAAFTSYGNALTLAVTGDGQITINSTDYTSSGSPHTINGLVGATALTASYPGSDDTLTWSGTNSADVTGSDPNYSITMNAAKSISADFTTAATGTLVGDDTLYATSDNFANNRVYYKSSGYVAASSGTGSQLCYRPASAENITLILYDDSDNSLMAYAAIVSDDLSGHPLDGTEYCKNITVVTTAAVVETNPYLLGMWSDVYADYYGDSSTVTLNYYNSTFTTVPPDPLGFSAQGAGLYHPAIWLK